MGQAAKNLHSPTFSRMGFALILGLLVTAAFFMNIQMAHAHPSEAAHIHGNHDHENHLSAQSPFEKHAGTRPLHCPLHNHPELLCPHENNNPSKRTVTIGPECGGHPVGQIPASQNIQDNPPISDSLLAGFTANSKLSSLPVLCKYIAPEEDDVTPPPRFLS
jgi:hypothetical protein